MRQNRPSLYRTVSTSFNCQFGLALLAVLGLVYGQAIGFSWVAWDDDVFIQGNPLLAQPSLSSLWEIFKLRGVPRETIYVPLTYLSFWIEAIMFNMHPSWVHGTNIIVHYINALLVFKLAKRLGAIPLAAAAAAFIFALHPLQVESVAWAMGRKSLLATCFLLIACISWHSYLKTEALRSAGLTVAAMIAACLCHPAILVFPAIAVAMAWASKPRPLTQKIGLCICAFGIVSISIFLINQQVAPEKFTQRPLPPGSFFAYSIVLLAGWAQRIMLTAPPEIFYPLADLLDPNNLTIIPAIIVLTPLVLSAWAARHGEKRPAFAILFWGLLFGPALYFLYTLKTPFATADRYGYFGLAGLALVVAPLRNRNAIAAVLVVSAIGGGFAAKQTGHWRNPMTFWSQATHEHPEYITAVHKLGERYLSQNNSSMAERLFIRAATLDPANSASSTYRVAQLKLRQGDNATAIKWLRRSLSANPGYAHSAGALAGLFLHENREQEALALCNRTLSLLPNDGKCRYYRGLIHLRRDNHDAAAQDLQVAASAQPTDVPTRFKLAMAYAKLNDYNRAVPELLAVVKIDPTHKTAWENLALIYQASGLGQKADYARRMAQQSQ